MPAIAPITAGDILTADMQLTQLGVDATAPISGTVFIAPTVSSVTVSSSAVTSTCLIFAICASVGNNAPIHEALASRVVGTSFTLNTGAPSAFRTISWCLLEPF